MTEARIEGTCVADAPPLASLLGFVTVGPLAITITETLHVTARLATTGAATNRLEGMRITDTTPLVSLTWSVTPVTLGTLVAETLRITERHGMEELDGVRVADTPPHVSLIGSTLPPPRRCIRVSDTTPLVSLTASSLTPSLSRMEKERVRVADKLVRVRRVRPRA